MAMTVWLFSVLLVTVLGQTPNWGNLTAEELAKIPSDVFKTVTAEEIGSIPPEACSGFLKAQLLVLNVSAVCTCLLDFLTFPRLLVSRHRKWLNLKAPGVLPFRRHKYPSLRCRPFLDSRPTV